MAHISSNIAGSTTTQYVTALWEWSGRERKGNPQWFITPSVVNIPSEPRSRYHLCGSPVPWDQLLLSVLLCQTNPPHFYFRAEFGSLLYVLYIYSLCVVQWLFMCFCVHLLLFRVSTFYHFFFFFCIYFSPEITSHAVRQTHAFMTVYLQCLWREPIRENAPVKGAGAQQNASLSLFFLFHPRHTPTKLLLSLSLSLHPSLHLSICSFTQSPPGAFHTAPCRERLDSPSPCAPRSGDSRRAARWQTGRAESFCPSDFCGGFLSLPLSLFSIIIIIISTTQGIVRLSFPGSSGNLSSHHRVPLPTSCNLSKRGAFVSATRWER